MNILRISFLLRSPSVCRDYKSANDKDLVAELTNALEGILSPAKPVCSSRGSVQHHFYVATEADPEQNKAAVRKMLEALIPDETLRKMIVVSVTEPDGDEIDKLRQKVDTNDNTAFWAAVQSAALPEKKTEPPKTNAMPLSKAAEKAADAVDPDQPAPPEEPEAAAAEEELPPLSEQTQKIQKLRDALLSKVRGQRHAVDAVVEGIFESEMFSALNPDRKGPLATFLFTGPSGVGKTFLASLASKCLDRPMLIVDMSEYSSNLSNGRMNGEHGQAAVVTGFVRQNPRGIIVFDEVEKAHINTIYQFLQILDGARMMDHQIKREVSFKDTIIILTTNAGASLYEDATVYDLSSVPRKVILDALRKDVNPQTQEPFFPECITTRMANGRVILFNHLEPYALLQIVQDELAQQVALFEKSAGIKVKYDPVSLAALVLYHGGGTSDARSLRGLARSIVVRELQEVLMQLLAYGAERVDALQEINLTIDTQQSEEVGGLFSSQERMQVAVLAENCAEHFEALEESLQTDFTVLTGLDECKRRVRGVTDYVLLDPLCGNREKDNIPNDVEDLDSDGMKMFEYLREYAPEIPVYILDTTGKIRSFETLLARGARGVIRMDGTDSNEMKKTVKELAFSALVNNVTFSLGRSSKFLNFNCAQYIIDDSCVVVAFERLQIKSVPQAGDGKTIAQKGENGNLKFADVIGCKAAKEALADYRDMLENPRKMAMKGKKMPKGVLLYGPPGTGKTMLAKAMANECNATFIPVSAAGFFGPLVGETERNIHDLFKRARKYAPSIIFIDEVDAIGRMRTGSVGSTHNEDALTVFLSEMDGFITDEKRPVFVLAATNYELEGESGRVLDPAFVRRFDRKILIPLPDTDDRYALLEKSLKRHGIHFGADHEKILKNMAKRTGGMNNADLEMVNANYARILGDGEPDGVAYMDSLDAYRFGEVNKMDPAHLRQTACHEAGHALVCRLCGVTPSFLTVVSRGGYGGFMESAGENTKGSYTYRELMDRVCRCLAGRAAEIEVYGDDSGTNTGASSDIRQARYFMKISLNDYAMGEKLYARWTQDEIEQEMKNQYERTCGMIREHRKVLDALTERLVQHKSMDQTQLEEFFTSMGV
ncbi:MAG: AAA family ATPase [Ruminococcaceae bacterium]|nr:AAA family ATPase [Oscillospiraceae bacterium]